MQVDFWYPYLPLYGFGGGGGGGGSGGGSGGSEGGGCGLQ